jgi:2-aminobenzoate-CoA ligase
MDYGVLPELAYPGRINAPWSCWTGWWTRLRGPDGHPLPGRNLDVPRAAEQADRIAHVLRDDLGVVPGTRVLLRGPNSQTMAAAWFAVLKAGGVAVATMPLLRARELAYVADKARVEVALCDERLARSWRRRAAAPVLARVATWGGGGDDSLEARMRGKPPSFDAVDTAADDVAMIAFTSGTTGTAKGTVHFHRDVLAICDCFPRYVLRAGARTTCSAARRRWRSPSGWAGCSCSRCASARRRCCWSSPRRPTCCRGSASTAPPSASPRPRRTAPCSTPWAREGAPTLRKCVSAGEALPLPTYQAWERATGVRIIDGIGSTEMLHIFISAREDEIRPGSTGRAVPGYRATVLDDEGREVPPGTIGRLAVQGPTGCRYLDDPERQRGYVTDGWNVTGDAYVMDEDGYFWYQARTDDMIISSGYNIAGPEVEAILLEHPAVLECGVVGLPDEERGQVVAAFVVLRPGHTGDETMRKTLQDHVKAEIAPYKYPRRIEFVDALPRTQTGKLQRFRLRETA